MATTTITIASSRGAWGSLDDGSKQRLRVDFRHYRHEIADKIGAKEGVE
jgi:hypothetical protein